MSDWNFFEEVDPFNEQNTVEGYISFARTNNYGALWLTKVNGYDVDNGIIPCTPKIGYPFDYQDGETELEVSFNNINKVIRMERYEKLDGTNIFAFGYKNHLGKRFVSYKTRMRPFIAKNSTFGNFYDMWLDMLAKYNVDNMVEKAIEKQYTLSFELWGARNPHLIKYEHPSLDASLLFARNEFGNVIPPSTLNRVLPNFTWPTATLAGIISEGYQEEYKQVQTQIESELQELGDDEYAGQEGEVWYVLTGDGKWTQYKLKPHTIEKIHWASGSINKNIIIASCYKAYESSSDHPGVDDVINILLEDFNSPDVDKVYYRIESYLKDVREKLVFRAQVKEEYEKLSPLNLNDNKVEVMRALSISFPKNVMNKVYSTVVNLSSN